MRIVHRKISTLLAIGMTVWLSGCYSIIDDCIECENSIVNNYRAHRAWGRCNDDVSELDHQYHVRKGFLDGYRAAAASGPTSSAQCQCQNEICLPLMPPRCYWKHCYQDCEGRQKIDAWYQGYAHGAMAASSDGIYQSSVIPTYGLYNGMQQPGAYHTTSLEEDGVYHDDDYLLPQPEGSLPGSDHLLPAPDTYDGLPKMPPAEEVPAPQASISGAAYEYENLNQEPQWATQTELVPVSNQTIQGEAETKPVLQQLPIARFTDVTTSESATDEVQPQTAGKFVLPVGYEGFHAPEWSEGANRE